MTILQGVLVRFFFLLATLSLFSSCKYQDAQLRLSDSQEIFSELTENKQVLRNPYGKTFSLNIVDQRTDPWFVGFRTPINIWQFEDEQKTSAYLQQYQSGNFFKAAILTLESDPRNLLGESLINALREQGMYYRRFDRNHVKIIIDEISFIPTMYRAVASVRLHVVMQNSKYSQYKTYEAKNISYKPMINALILGPFNPGMSQGFHEGKINETLLEVLDQIIADNKIWQFLD